jgi:tRNA(fMet)-specific endonuclease VapC
MYIFDTDICVEVLRNQNEAIVERVKKLPAGEICISVVTLAELEFGVQHSGNIPKNAAALKELLLDVEVLPFTADAAAVYGRVYAELKKSEKRLVRWTR